MYTCNISYALVQAASSCLRSFSPSNRAYIYNIYTFTLVLAPPIYEPHSCVILLLHTYMCVLKISTQIVIRLPRGCAAGRHTTIYIYIYIYQCDMQNIMCVYMTYIIISSIADRSAGYWSGREDT